MNQYLFYSHKCKDTRRRGKLLAPVDDLQTDNLIYSSNQHIGRLSKKAQLMARAGVSSLAKSGYNQSQARGTMSLGGKLRGWTS